MIEGKSDHITCSLCKTHFCWIYLEIHDKEIIYDHIDNHHNIYDERDLTYQNYYDIINKGHMDIYNIPICI